MRKKPYVPAPLGEAPRILIVDDLKDSVELIAAILRHQLGDVVIHEALSGKECLEIAAREKIDVILLDAKMPHMDGFETCRRLKASPRTATTPVLMVSGILTTPRHRVSGMEVGADGYLCKPFENEELVAQVEVLLRIKRAEDELRSHESHLQTELASRTDALSKSESRFRALFEYSPDAVFVENRKGIVLDVNQAACRLHGVARDQLVGRNVLDLVPEDERKAVAAQFPAWFTGNIHQIEGFSHTMDGRRIPVEIRASLIDFGGEKALILHVRDITARKIVEDSLRLSEARYRAIVEEQTELIIRQLPDTTLTFANEAVIRYMGLPREQIVGHQCVDFILKDDREKIHAAIASLTPDHPVCAVEFRLMLPDGRTRWHHWIKRGIFERDGRMAEIQAIGHDITERLEVERRQQTLLRGMREIVEIADELIGSPDEDSLYRLAVELARKKLGLERVGILINRDPWVQSTFGTDYEGNTTDERLNRAPMDKTWQETMRLRQPSEPRWSTTKGKLVYWNGQRLAGNRTGWIAITPIQTAHKSIGILCNDTAITGAPMDESVQEIVAVFCSLFANIAERKAAERERSRLAVAVEQSAESVLITDTDGVIHYANPGFERMTGYRREDVIGKTPRLLKSGKHSEAFYRRMWNTLQRGQVWTGRMTNRRRDGSFFEVEHTISPVRDDKGLVVSYLSVSQDVTAAVQMEAELRQAQKMESIGRLAGGIAHDFNNLLTAILGFARMADAEIDPQSSLKEDITEIISAGERASRLTKQLLSFGRKQVIQIQPADPNQIVANMENILRRTLGEHIELTTELATDLGFIEVDSGQIEQVIMNLAINSFDAMPRGGRLAIKTGSAVLSEEYCRKHISLRPGPYITLTVRDNGCGMPDHVRERAFEPFFTTKEKGKGSGLGLATVYGIVRQYRGHIELTTEVNVGTEFVIYLPKSSAESAAVPVEIKPLLQTGTETILIVEDESIVRRLAQRNLHSLGYHVIEAKNGEEALAIYQARKEPIHLVLTDVVMPKLNGPDLVAALHQTDPELPVLYMSGFADDMFTRGIQAVGDIALIVKPFTREILAHHVRAALDKPREKTAAPAVPA